MLIVIIANNYHVIRKGQYIEDLLSENLTYMITHHKNITLFSIPSLTLFFAARLSCM